MKINSLKNFFFSFLFTVGLYFFSLRLAFTKMVFIDGLIGIFLAAFLLILFSTINVFFRKKNSINDFFTLIFIFLNPSFFLVSFHLIYPVTFDRSISVYTLSYLRTYYPEKEFNEDKVNQLIQNGFLRGKLASKRRIKEQIKVGNFKQLENGNLLLTKRGINFVDSARIYARILNLSRDYLWPSKIIIE